MAKSAQERAEEQAAKTPGQKLKDRLAGITQKQVLGNKAISTGSLFFDLQLNPRLPGLKCGKTHVVAGRPGAGKTSLMLSAARALLAKNKKNDPNPRIVVYIDVENGLDESQLALYGLTKYNTPNFEYKVCNYGPDVLKMIEQIIRDFQGYESEVLIILDSIPHLSFSDVDDLNDYSKTAAVAQGPNKLKVFFRENKALLANTNICLVSLTFMTANINKVNKWDPPYILSGGSYLEYAADIAIELKAKGQPRETEVPPPDDDKVKKAPGLGKFQDISVHWIKNKTAIKQPFFYTLCLIDEDDYKPGIQDLSLMVDYACKKCGIQKGAWIDMDGGKWNGKAKFKESIREAALAHKEGRVLEKLDGLHQSLYNLVRNKILEERKIKDITTHEE